MESEEWTVVKSTRPVKKSASVPSSSSGKSGKAKKPQNHVQLTAVDSTRGKSVDQLQEEVQSTIRKLQNTLYYEAVLRSVTTALSASVVIIKIVALGIGSVAQSHNSLWQFALLVQLSQDLLSLRAQSSGDEAKENIHQIIRIECFDPIATAEDEQLCERFAIHLLRENNKGLFPVGISEMTEETVIYYMPHCPYRLYCNVLWSHWNVLRQLCILGNSFESYSLHRVYANDNNHGVRQNQNQSQSKKKGKKKQEEGNNEPVQVADSTDLAMRLLPYLSERKLWPLAAMPRPSGGTDATVGAQWKEDKGCRHFLEGAFSELSCIRFDPSTVADHLQKPLQELLNSRPSEDDMLQATSTDVEVF